MNVRYPQLQFGTLTARPTTDLIVIHHTGTDLDASAEMIHDWHLAQGWAGIGYHFVIRRDGTVEIGRPEWSVGAHAYGFNNCSVGIHLSGDFNIAQPSYSQLHAAKELVADLLRSYHFAKVVGHCDLMPTDCPGKNLYAHLTELAQGF